MLNGNGFIKLKISLICIFLILLSILSISFAEDRPLANKFPNQTFIIGTYAIDYKALDGNTIGLAKNTVEESGQEKIYYKSDLTSKKLWIDITNGESISDITDQSSNIISDIDIDNIVLTHWIKDDGTVVVFSTGEIMKVNDLHTLLDPRANIILQKLATEYDLAKGLYESNDENMDAKKTIDALILTFKPIGEEVILPYNKKLDTIDLFINYITENSNDNYSLSIAKKIKEDILVEREIATLETSLKHLKTGAKIALKSNLTSLNSDIWEAIGNTESKIEELKGKLESDGSSLLSQYRNLQIDNLNKEISNGNYPLGLLALEKIKSVDNITNDFIIDEDKEMAILNIIYFQSLNKVKAKDELEDSLNEMEIIYNTILGRTDYPKDKIKILNLAKKAVEDTILSIGQGTSEDEKESLETLEDFLDKIKDEINAISALSDDQTANMVEYLDSLDNQIDNLYDTYLGALENNNKDLADLILEKMEEIINAKNEIYETYGELYKETLKAVNEGEDLDIQKEKLAKYELLLSETDKELLDIYKDNLDEMKELFKNDEYADLGKTLDEYVSSYENLPDYLQNDFDIGNIINELISKAEEFYLLNQDDLGDELLSLTENLKEPINFSDETVVYDDYILVDIKGIEKDGIVYIPIKEFYNFFNIDVVWHEDSAEIEVMGITNTEIFSNDSKLVKKGNENFVLDNPVFILNGISYCEIGYFSKDIENFIMPNNRNLTLIIIPKL